MQITEDLIERAEQLLINGNSFDDERRNFIKCLKSVDLLAVPGSGKTTTLQAKLYCMEKRMPLNDNSGILVLSHTNAAVDEIKSKLQSSCPRLFEYPNFIGTVQEFVDRFLAVPFYNKTYGQSITRIDGTLYKKEYRKLLDNFFPKNDNAWYWYKFNQLSLAEGFNVKIYENGTNETWDYKNNRAYEFLSSVPKRWGKDTEKNKEHIKDILWKLKKRMFIKGILNYDDCYVLAQAYIAEHPSIKSILRKRFKYVFIDETQDLQGHQLEITDMVFDHETVCMQRIGDVNQSIYHSSKDNYLCEWVPRNVMTLSNSFRLTDNISKVVDPFMCIRADGHQVIGRRTLAESIPTIMFIYDYEHRDKLLPAFREKITTYNLEDTPESKKYGFHLIGWNAVWKDDDEHVPQQLRLTDIFSSFKNVSQTTIPSTLAEHIQSSAYIDNTSAMVKLMDTVICESLRLCGKNVPVVISGNRFERPYTSSTLHELVETLPIYVKKEYQRSLLKFSRLLYSKNYVDAYDFLKEYLHTFLRQNGVDENVDFAEFIASPLADNDEVHNVDEPLVSIEKVHNVKGQTHCATLYVETMYQGCYESEHLLKEKKKATKRMPAVYYGNPFYGENVDDATKAYAKRAIKMLYVGLSRPTHLLCYAMHKSVFEKYDRVKLEQCGWIIEDLTIEHDA